MNHWLKSAIRAFVIMVLDVVAFAAFGITMGRNSPQWITRPMWWVLAWPVAVFRPIFPNHTPGAHAPSILAWFCGGVVDIIWVTLLVDWLWRPKAKVAAAPGP
jgi:hypothetical protein